MTLPSTINLEILKFVKRNTGQLVSNIVLQEFKTMFIYYWYYSINEFFGRRQEPLLITKCSLLICLLY